MDYYIREASHVDRQKEDCFYYVGLGIFSSFLVSLCWWENTMQAKNRMQVFHKHACLHSRCQRITISETPLCLTSQKVLAELEGFRDFVFVISSILRILVIGNYLLPMLVSVYSSQNDAEKSHLVGKCLIAQLHCGLICLEGKESTWKHKHIFVQHVVGMREYELRLRRKYVVIMTRVNKKSLLQKRHKLRP